MFLTKARPLPDPVAQERRAHWTTTRRATLVVGTLRPQNLGGRDRGAGTYN